VDVRLAGHARETSQIVQRVISGRLAPFHGSRQRSLFAQI
jgi:hypothetical protein